MTHHPERADKVAGERFLPAYDGGPDDPPPWDLGRPQPAILELFDDGEVVGSVLDVGCGSGEHALLAAERGHEAHGIDLVPTAVEQARAKAVERGLAPGGRGPGTATFEVLDLYDLPSLGRTWDAAIDCVVFHLVERPADYAEALAAVLRPGGRWWAVAFDPDAPGDGPRGMTPDEAAAAFGSHHWRFGPATPTRQLGRGDDRGRGAWLFTAERLAD